MGKGEYIQQGPMLLYRGRKPEEHFATMLPKMLVLVEQTDKYLLLKDIETGEIQKVKPPHLSR